MSQQKTRSPLPLENVRARLLGDPDTRRIAQDVGLELEEYVELVLHYASHPDQEPQLYVAPDEELRAAGYDAPSAEAVSEFFLAGARGELGIGNAQVYSSQFERSSNNAGKPRLRADEDPEPVSGDEDSGRELLRQALRQGPLRV